MAYLLLCIRNVEPASPSYWRRNALSLAFLGLTLLSLLGHVLSGHLAENQERLQHGLFAIDLWQYVRSGVFLSSLFENWESEFLQMLLFVVLTVRLRQRGSSESKPFEEENNEELPPLEDAPWPVRRGGRWRRLYEHSLSLALLGLFVGSFVGHWCGSYRHYVAQVTEAGRSVDHGLLRHVLSSEFWFESFQNWQSEFLSISALLILSIYLREKGSPQSKEVRAPHWQTGG